MIRRMFKIKLNQAVVVVFLALGTIVLFLSGLYVSSFLAILGVAFLFCGTVTLSITQTRHVRLTMLGAAYDASNIERLMAELDLKRGIYLPPKNLKDTQSSLVFIPQTSYSPLPTPSESTDTLRNMRKDAVFLTPPGMGLCQLFEQELGKSFFMTDLNQLQTTLPKLLVDNLEIANNVEVRVSGNSVTVKVDGNVLAETCQKTKSQPFTHASVGCLLTSAIACALAKSSGEPIVILKETQNVNAKIIQMNYEILKTYPNPR